MEAGQGLSWWGKLPLVIAVAAIGLAIGWGWRARNPSSLQSDSANSVAQVDSSLGSAAADNLPVLKEVSPRESDLRLPAHLNGESLSPSSETPAEFEQLTTEAPLTPPAQGPEPEFEPALVVEAAVEDAPEPEFPAEVPEGLPAVTQQAETLDSAPEPRPVAQRLPRTPVRDPIRQVGFEEDAPPAAESTDTVPTAVTRKPNAPTTAVTPVVPAAPSPLPEAPNQKGDWTLPFPQALAAMESTESLNMPLKDMAEIDQLVTLGDIPTAQRELTRWLCRAPEMQESVLPRIIKQAEPIYFAGQPHYESAYVIQPGDQLRSIAAKHKLTWEYLARLNQVDPRKIRAGRKLKVVQGPFSAFVSLSNYVLIVHNQGSFVKIYRVGTGKGGSTPVGNFTVKDKLVNPTYFGPDGVVKADDPKNPLGERWIDIGDSYGIHGTIEPDSIGKSESRGCVRLMNKDVEEVYDFLTVGSTVTIAQ